MMFQALALERSKASGIPGSDSHVMSRLLLIINLAVLFNKLCFIYYA